MKIAIVDYGSGNIFSIQRAIQYVGYGSIITSDRDTIMSSDRLVLPGVGAFGDAIEKLKEKGLYSVLIDYARSGKPMLGVCLGMQLLMTSSEEFGFHEGLNLVAGRVVRFPAPDIYGIRYKIPHVGWNMITHPNSAPPMAWENTLLSSSKESDYVYFVHSYIVKPDANNVVLAVTNHGGVSFASVIRKDNIAGCQFHPELSGAVGLNIYRRFVEEKIGAYEKAV